MHGDDDYADIQQPDGPYGPDGGTGYASGQGDLADAGMFKKAPKPKAKANPPEEADATSDPDKVAMAMSRQMAKLYVKIFRKNNVTLGPRIGKPVVVKLVPDADMKTALDEDARRTFDGLIHAWLKFNPELMLKRLQKYYATLEKPLPARLHTIDEHTVLTEQERSGLFALMEMAVRHEATDESDGTQGFYQLPANPKTIGIIYIRASLASSSTFTSDLAGLIAHEMAHAYADEGWRDFRRVMFAVGMGRTGKLEEGVASLIEEKIIDAWMPFQPTKTPRPPLGYKDDSEVQDSQDRFVNDVSVNVVLLTFFGGWVRFGDENKPQNTIKLGRDGKVTWSWPAEWR